MEEDLFETSYTVGDDLHKISTDGILKSSVISAIQEWIDSSAQGNTGLMWQMYLNDHDLYIKYGGRWVFWTNSEADLAWFMLKFADSFKGREVGQ